MRIAVIAYDQISPFMLSTPLAVFGGPLTGHQVDICAARSRVSAQGGLTIDVPHPLDAAGAADVVLLPGWRDHAEPLDQVIIEQLQAAQAGGAIVVGLCLGAFGLAQAGLLDGKCATTHWARIEAFAARFPKVLVDPVAIFVDEGNLLTSAGVASGLDCCLHLLSRISGAGQANRVARHMLVAPQRSGNQAQLIEHPVIGSTLDRRLADILGGIHADPRQTPSLDQLAAQAGMSRRSLSRHIRARTGGSLGDWTRQARVARAQELLLAGVRGLDKLADLSGFATAQALRCAFRIELGMSPRQWLARRCTGATLPADILPSTQGDTARP
jgi:transcriptional regulator GlxA family with amidase domain